ncbi:hypothetical protein C1631_022835 [Chryseobacterium phosphatilyticum]|uniref:HTH cro/C1-type domain-containing protein n=1 Tax=Chryseobacterium phosphatilyticum TaxID=475075 RepID=A0A316WLV7_9FLAO|nr:helix-turn-helix transcriptional regulator [Chryseobacterium phosphatilyticum]PWN62404.1 hypothetical protein C1631_022835 [Chryseobacterium phosphatilyticum]
MQKDISMYLNKITDILQRKRINQNISVEDLVKKCNEAGLNISSDTILKLEKGQYIPNSDQLFIILTALGSEIEIEELIIK